MLIILTLVALMRGNGEIPSFIGIKRCDPFDWVLLLILVISCFACSIFGIYTILKPEYERKMKMNYKFVEGDFECTFSNSLKLSLTAFFGSILGSMCGTGTGYIFSPVLISMNIHPMVATSTSMYNTLYVTLSATIVFAIFGMVNLPYLILFNLFTIIGTIPGIYLQKKCVKWTGKSWVTVAILQGNIFMVFVSLPVIMILDLAKNKN
jgi:hypothetical protein